MPILVVARFLDGRLVKGTTINFRPESDHCHVVPLERPYGEGARVDYRDLKAMFFVKDLRGNPEYRDQMTFTRPTGYGTRVRIAFKDGEKMVGIVHHLDPNLLGFFLFPADPYSNNERVYAMYQAVASVEPIGRDGAGEAAPAAAPKSEEATPVEDQDARRRGLEAKAAADSRAERAIAQALDVLKVKPAASQAPPSPAAPADAQAPAPAATPPPASPT